MTEQDEEIVRTFLEESSEALDGAERDLIALESRPEDADLIADIFRSLHTIKGSSGFLGYPRIESLAHSGESLLAAVRDGEITLSAEATTALLRLIDAIREVLRRIETDRDEGAADFADILADLARQREQAPDAGPPEPEAEAATEAATRGAPPGEAEPADAEPAEGEPAPAQESSVRVSVEALDNLMALVSELTIIRSQIGTMVAAGVPEHLAQPLGTAYRRLDHVAAELQREVMDARLQPIGTVISRFRRVGRDLAMSMGKEVRVEIEGESVAVDRAINEALRDPLMHIVRNAIGHGIETPSERVAAGKPPVGLVEIRATHAHGRVTVEVSDDGRGMDRKGLIDSAVRSGRITADQASSLTAKEAIDLSLLPGVSTAGDVTSLSGRGVGLDVVRSNLEKIGGRVEISSQPGAGTTVLLNVPLTLAILPVLTVWCGGQRYALSQAAVASVRRIRPGDLESEVEHVESGLIFRFRGHPIPAVRLAGVLQVDEPEEGDRHLVVVEANQLKLALVVTEVGDVDDVVVTPLTRATRHISVFAGVTIHGDGRPILIMDVLGLAHAAGVTSAAAAPEEVEAEEAPEAAAAGMEVLLARAPAGGRWAFPLGAVLRVERFPSSSIELVGDLKVVRYGDDIIPLIGVVDFLPEHVAGPAAAGPEGAEGVVEVIVCGTRAGTAGLIVGRIDDVATAPHDAKRTPGRGGISEYLSIRDHVAELIDIDALADRALAGGER